MDGSCNVCNKKFDGRASQQKCVKCKCPIHKTKCSKQVLNNSNPNSADYLCNTCDKPESKVMSPSEQGKHDEEVNKNAPATKSDIQLLMQEFNNVKEMLGRLEPLEYRVETLEKNVEELGETVMEIKYKNDYNSEYSRRNNLELHGIPQTKEEDVYEIVGRLGAFLKIDLNTDFIDVAHRIPAGSNRIKPIIVKFTNRWKKEEVLTERIGKKILASDIGFKSEQRIFINENLTPEKRKLAMDTRRFFKDKKCNTWTQNGAIIVARRFDSKEERKKMGSDPKARKYTVSSFKDLKEIAIKLGFDDLGKQYEEK